LSVLTWFSINTLVYFDGKDDNLYLRLQTMSHII